MKTQWQTIKTIINASKQDKETFLSLINEEGIIVCVNATMAKALHLKNPRKEKTNFFDLLHPSNKDAFRAVVRNSTESKTIGAIELYLKNGYYHPMKWEVNQLKEKSGEMTTYLCVGHTIPGNQRMKLFNELCKRNYQLIIEGINAGILFQDKKGELISANQQAADIFNTTLENLYQLNDIASLWNTIWEITTENGSRVLFEDTPFAKALQTGKPQTEVLIIRLRNGEIRWVYFNSQPLFEDGSTIPFSVVSSIVDVSRERNLTNELKEREALFQTFMNETPNMAWVVDEDANLIFANRSFYQYFSLDEKKSIHKNIMELIPGTVANALYEKHVEVLKTGKAAEMVEKVKWADGLNFIFHINIFPVDGVTSKKMLGGHAVNLTEKFKVEKQLMEAKERLLLLSRTTSDAIWEWDMQAGNIFRNDVLMNMIGYQLEHTKGLSWWLRRIHPDDRNRVTDKIKDATDKGQQSWQDEYRFKCADGNYKHINDRGYIVYENNLPVRMIGSLQDITGLKDLQNLLTEEKLNRQKEISETIIRVQEKERTRIGHELHDNVNQILSTVKLFVDMLTPANKEEEQLKIKSIEYLSLAVEEVRQLSRELVVPQLIGKGLVDSIQNLINDIHISGKLTIDFTYEYTDDLLSPGKKVTLFRIVQEQLKNIIKHSGGKNTSIKLQNKGNNTQLIIKDDGVGFDPKQTHRGIGLSNIYERTRFYNGTVDINTAKGEGCTVTVTIPTFN